MITNKIHCDIEASVDSNIKIKSSNHINQSFSKIWICLEQTTLDGLNIALKAKKIKSKGFVVEQFTDGVKKHYIKSVCKNEMLPNIKEAISSKSNIGIQGDVQTNVLGNPIFRINNIQLIGEKRN